MSLFYYRTIRTILPVMSRSYTTASNKTMEYLNNEKYLRSAGRENPAVRHIWRLQELAEKHSVPDVVKNEIDVVLKLIQARTDYSENMTSPLSAEMSYILRETFSHPWQKVFEEKKTSYRVIPTVITRLIEAQFLKFVVGMSNAKRVLELGLLTGLGALAIAETLPEDGEVYSCESEPYLQELARSFLDRSPHGKKVKIKGPALETLQQMAENGVRFDVIYMDHDKMDYISCYNFIMEKNILNQGGTIIADNVYAYGYPYSEDGLEDGKGIRDFNQMIKNDERVNQVLIPFRDGVTVIRRK